MNNIPVLITSAVNVIAKEKSLRDVEERLKYTVDGIKYWLLNYPNTKLIICDGTGYDLKPFFTGDEFDNIEILFFKNNYEKVLEKGGGDW